MSYPVPLVNVMITVSSDSSTGSLVIAMERFAEVALAATEMEPDP